MQVTLTSKFNVGDKVRSAPDSEHIFSGEVIEVEFGESWWGFTYKVRAPDGELHYWLREYEVHQ